MRFDNSEMLYLLILIPVIFIIYLICERKRKRQINLLGTEKTLEKFSAKSLSGNIIREGIYLSCAVLFLILALAKPQAGTRLEPVRITGSDIYIALDLSASMRVEDVKPNRFERAKIDALELVQSLRGDRAGLILFAGDAFVQCPLTQDYDALIGFISSLDYETAFASGTSLTAPLEVALRSLKPEHDKYAMVVMLTDGEDTIGFSTKTLKEVKNRGIKVFTIGIGTKEGAPIPVYDQAGKRTGYKKDQTGKVVISSLNDHLLKLISEETQGYYFEAQEKLNEITKLLGAINNMKKRELETKRYTVYEERFQFPLGLGLIFVIFYSLQTVKSKRRPW